MRSQNHTFIALVFFRKCSEALDVLFQCPRDLGRGLLACSVLVDVPGKCISSGCSASCKNTQGWEWVSKMVLWGEELAAKPTERGAEREVKQMK